MRLLFYTFFISLCFSCSKNKIPEITSFTSEFISETDSSEVYRFKIVATDHSWISNIKVNQIEDGEIITTFSQLAEGAGAPTSGLGRTFVTNKEVAIELKAEVSDDSGNVTEKVIQVN